MKTGAPWHDLPNRYPPYQTCHRRYQVYCLDGTFEQVLKALAEDLRDHGDLDLSETFIYGTFAPAKKGGSKWDLPVGAKARRSWPLQTALVFFSLSAQKVLRRMTVRLVEKTLRSRFVSDPPQRLIDDKAYDSDKLDERLLCKYGSS